MMPKHYPGFLVAGVLVFLASATSVLAVPSFARKYETSCATCHAPYPKLNYFGRAFKNNGYRYPGGVDAEVTKDQPVSLGAEGYKKMWPQALWPAHIPGKVPLAVRAILRASEYENDAEASTFEFPHELELLAAGTIGDTMSFFGEFEFENEDNEIETGVDFALQYDPRPSLHVRVGTLAVHPIPDNLRLTAAHYSSYDARTTPGSLTLDATNPNDPDGPPLSISAGTGEDRWRYRNSQPGIEIWGARNGGSAEGGLTWHVGIVNGQGLNDANDDKDVFALVQYKFGGYGVLGSGEAATTDKFWRDDSFRIGVLLYDGTSTNNYEGSLTALDPADPTGLTDVEVGTMIENDFDVKGVDFDWWFRNLNLFGLYSMRSDDNPLGTGEGIDTDAWFVEADYTFLPWLVGVVRYGETDFDFDVSSDPEAQELLVPAVVFVSRANVKFTLEGQLRLDDAGKGNDRYIVGVDFAF